MERNDFELAQTDIELGRNDRNIIRCMHPAVHLSGRPGKPTFGINREQLEYFLFYDFDVQDIADALSVSKSTVQRRFREYRISVSSAMSQQTDNAKQFQFQSNPGIP